jgi:hypothetical protein
MEREREKLSLPTGRRAKEQQYQSFMLLVGVAQSVPPIVAPIQRQARALPKRHKSVGRLVLQEIIAPIPGLSGT